jgi:hypothetical protein
MCQPISGQDTDLIEYVSEPTVSVAEQTARSPGQTANAAGQTASTYSLKGVV